MKTKRSLLYLIIVMLLVFSLACLVGGGETVTDQRSEDSVATSVAATLAAVAAGEEDPVEDETAPPTQHPTVTVGPKEPNFTYAGVSFYFNPILADDLTAGVEPGFYEENNPWWSTPEHRLYRFNNWVLSDAFHSPVIRIYLIADFRAINENVSNGLDALALALNTQPEDYAGLVVSDMFNAGQLYQSNLEYLDFQNGRGARWLAQYGQGYSSVGWPNLFYTFQGLTDDGQFYVSMILPVNHPYLPLPDDVTLDDDFYENYGEYRDNVVTQLESESDNTFIPSLVLLDEIVESLLVLSD